MTSFTISTPDPKEHRIKISDLINSQWHRMAGRTRDPNHQWTVSRMGVADDKIVTFWGVWDITLRIGTAQVKTGGVDAVVTHADYRRRGYMRQTADAAIASMRENGYVLSLLNGIDDFYEMFGYAPAWPKHCITVSVDELPAERPPYLLDEFVPSFREDLAALYNAESALLTGTAIRPTYRTFKWPGQYTGYLWNDDNGTPLGYIIGDYEPADEENTTFTCVDAAGDPEQIMRLLGVITRSRGYKEVAFDRLHPRSRLARYLRRRNCTVESVYRSSGNCMAAVIDFNGLMTQLAPELTRRLAQSPMSDWAGHMHLRYNDSRITLAVKNGEVRVGEYEETPHGISGGRELVQLFLGRDDPMEIVEAADIELSGDAERLIQVLFPAQDPQIAAVDL